MPVFAPEFFFNAVTGSNGHPLTTTQQTQQQQTQQQQTQQQQTQQQQTQHGV
jgi:hypothetical protein